MKKLMLGAAVAALTVTGAFAQAPASSDSKSPPAATTSSPPAAGTTSAPATMPSAGTASGSMNFVSTQSPDQFLASKFKGTDVIGTDNAKIGDVSDILFDKSGKIEAFVVSVGGFLGVGAKDVAIAPTAFEVIKGNNGEADKLKLAATKDQLKQAQNFQPYHEPRTTTGAGGSMGGRPATAPAPATTR